jgi:hypothetical protein
MKRKLADHQTRLRTQHLFELMFRKPPDPDKPIDDGKALERMMLDQHNISYIFALDPSTEDLLTIRNRNRAWAEYWARHHPFAPESYQRLVEDLREIEKENVDKANRRLRKRGVIALQPN